MRALVVHAGPQFSVMDVANGWVRGLQANGVDVMEMDLHNALWYFSNTFVERDGEWIPGMSIEQACFAAGEQVQAYAFRWLPDVTFIVSGFFLNEFTVQLLRARGSKVVWLMTESPYEETTQLRRAGWAADLVVLNDPTHLGQYADAGISAMYVPHSYDPAVHRPGPADPGCLSDVCIVGTGYPSRVRFLEQIDWTDVDLALLGMWKTLEGHPLAEHVRGVTTGPDDPDRYEVCIDNRQTVTWYRSTRASLNLYRREAEADTLTDGYAMGPREVELAACGTFFVTEARGENVDRLPMVPKVATPAEADEMLRWYLAHDDERLRVADAARRAVEGWTFEARAAEVLRLLEQQPVTV